MQTTDIAPDKSTATATLVSPTTSQTQELVNPAPTASPPASAKVPLDLDPDLLTIADELAAKVREAQAASLTWMIEAGVRLRAYRDSLEVDDWLQVLRSRRLPVGARTAQMLIRIASHPSMRDQQCVQHLPHAISILNLLAGLPASVVEQAMDAGVINRDMSLKEAQRLIWQSLTQAAPEEAQTCRPQLL